MVRACRTGPRLGDELKHLAYGGFQADENASGHNGVADVELFPIRDSQYKAHVRVIQAMPGVHDQTFFGCITGGRLQPGHFVHAKIGHHIGKPAGVKLDGISPELHASVDLFRSRFDEHAHPKKILLEDMERIRY